MKKIYILATFLVLTCVHLNAQIEVLQAPFQVFAAALNGNDLYVSNYDGNKISRIDITAAIPTPTDVVTGLNKPVGLFFEGNTLYIAESGAGKISKIDITEATPTPTDFVTGLSGPFYMVKKGDDLYVSQFFGGKISKIDITESTPTIIDVATDLGGPTGMQFKGNDLYFSRYFASKISKIDITEATPTPTDLYSATGYEIALKGNDLYFYDFLASKIFKIDITETAPVPEVFATTTNSIYGLMINENDLYTTNTDGLILKYEIPGTPLSIQENLVTKTHILFPNPTADFIQILNLKKEESYLIYDLLGAVIKRGFISNNEQIEVRDLAKGVHFLKFENGNTFKFIKK